MERWALRALELSAPDRKGRYLTLPPSAQGRAELISPPVETHPLQV